MRSARVIAILLASARVHAAPLACPSDTHARSSIAKELSQDWCERSNGTRHGPYRSFRGKLRSAEGQYVDGEQDGAWMSWWDNGQPLDETHYQHGVKHGAWTVRAENGVLMVQGEYRLGKEHGAWTWWHRNGKKKAVASYVDGLKRGRETEWDEDGYVISDGKYDAGKKVGAWVYDDRAASTRERGGFCAGKRCGRWEFFDQGLLAAAGEYRDDRREGVWKQWREGKLYKQGAYSHGKKTGRWTTLDVDAGRKQTEIDCRNGIPEGVRREWWPNGGIRMTGHYVDGQLDGAWTQGDETGHRTSSVYKDGKLVRGDEVEPGYGYDSAADGEHGRMECEPEPHTPWWSPDNDKE